MHDHSLAPRNDASLLCGNLGTSGKLLWGTLLVAVVFGQFFCNQEPSFTTFFMFVFLSGDLKIAAGNFSEAEVLTNTLKMKSFSTRF